jgi:hypothetical protein
MLCRLLLVVSYPATHTHTHVFLPYQAFTVDPTAALQQHTLTVEGRFDGHFGTINGQRMGRLRSQYIEWNEINAGWGYATLLLVCLAQKTGFAFTESALCLSPLSLF